MDWADKRETLALIAQQDAATASIVSAIGALVSVGLLVWTLRETRKTANASINSAAEARRAADIAEQALTHAKSISEVDLAPYVVFFDSSIHINASENVEITFSYKNYGKAPAKNVKFRYGSAAGYPPVMQPALNREGAEHAVIAPGQACSDHLIMPYAGDDELESLEQGQILVLTLALEWQSIAGDRQSLVQTMVVDSHAVRSKRLRLPLDMEILPA